MKIKTHIHVITLSALAFAISAQAHDPKEHMKDAQAPDCAAMKDMDHSKMDMDDPVTQAMMKKCMKGMKGMDHDKSENGQASDEHHSDKKSSDEQHPEQQEDEHPEPQPD